MFVGRIHKLANEGSDVGKSPSLIGFVCLIIYSQTMKIEKTSEIDTFQTSVDKEQPDAKNYLDEYQNTREAARLGLWTKVATENSHNSMKLNITKQPTIYFWHACR